MSESVYMGFAEAKVQFQAANPDAKLGIMVRILNQGEGVVPERSSPLSTFYSGGATWAEVEAQMVLQPSYDVVVCFFDDDIEAAREWSQVRGGHIYVGGGL
jgi:hypothetical protein